jgi:hypothetical protein
VPGAWRLVLLCFVATSVAIQAQTLERAAIDTVGGLTPGRIQNTGQSPAFFPANLFGVPDPRATDTTPSTDPREICSIGVDGQIIVGFADHAVVDAPGPDLIIFENAFRYGAGRLYAEPAMVEVSRDGVTWTAFPFDSATLIGCAGVTPTTGADPFDPMVSGGDAFDLSDIGIDSVRWIRITDLCQMILSDRTHQYYDPTLSGFDLDAITTPHAVRVADALKVTVAPRAAIIEISIPRGVGRYQVHDVSGRLLWEEELAAGIHQRSLYHLAVTCGLVTVSTDADVRTIKVLR